MTFDEAIEELRLAIPEKFYSPTMHDIAVILEAQTKVINLLREEYAPTIEMTKNKVKEVNSIVHEVGEEFEQDELPDDIKTTDKMIELEDGFVLLKDLNAILHPETIKIVDE